MKPYNVDEQKWRSFSADMQLKNIAAEFSRAARAGTGATFQHSIECWNVIGENKEQKEQEKGAYERAIALIDAAIADPQWKENDEILYRLRDVAASLYARGGDAVISRFIEAELLRGTRDGK